MKKIYIAGPDVFEPNSIEIGKQYAKICEQYGFFGMYPLDNMIDFNQEKKKIALDIFLANVELIKQADIVVANLNPFRGKEADSGTIWECGYASGLGKEVVGYMDCTIPYSEQFLESEKSLSGDFYVDAKGCVIEDFDYPINLMIACSVKNIVQGSFEDAIKTLEN
jgi:nucleoside 2-deoxyribosyltransferase